MTNECVEEEARTRSEEEKACGEGAGRGHMRGAGRAAPPRAALNFVGIARRGNDCGGRVVGTHARVP